MPINMFPKGGSSRRLRVSKLSEQRTAHHFASEICVLLFYHDLVFAELSSVL